MLIDDNVHLEENLLLQPPTLEHVGQFWKAPFLGLYIPATYTLWSAEARLAYSPETKKLDPGVFHRVSLVLHSLNSLFVFVLLLALLPAGPAMLGALFFSLHPVQTEAVAWASAQKDLLCGLFSLISLWQYVLFVKTARRGHYALALGLYLLALLSKPAAVGVGFTAWALEVGVLGGSAKRSFQRLWPWLAFAIPILAITKYLQPDQHIGPMVALWQRPFVALDTFAFYLAKTLVPLRLAPDYSRSPDALIHHWMVYVSWLIPLILGFLFARRVRGSGYLAVIFLGGILPVLGFIPFYFQVFSTVADRYLYLSLLAPALVFARLYSYRWGKPVAAAVLVLLGALSFQQAAKWKDSQTLFEHTIRVNPGSLLAHNNLGAILEAKGEYKEAYQHYTSSMKIAPDSVPPLYNIARLQAMQGNYKLAKPIFEEVLRRQPDVAEAHQSLGAIYNKEGDYDKAEQHLRIALQIRPDFEKARRLLNEALAKRTAQK